MMKRALIGALGGGLALALALATWVGLVAARCPGKCPLCP